MFGYKNLHEIFNRNNITLVEIMIEMDVTDFLFMPNSPVLKNHLLFDQAFKSFWKRYKKGRPEIYVSDTTIRSSCLGFVTGVAYWFFHEGVVKNFITLSYKIIDMIHKFYTNYHKTSMFYQKV